MWGGTLGAGGIIILPYYIKDKRAAASICASVPRPGIALRASASHLSADEDLP